MGKLLLTLIICVVAPLLAGAQTTFTSTVTGLWSSTTTWGGSGPPGNSDNVIITSGTVVTHSTNEDCARVTINNGGELVSNARIRASGAYINNGTHSGTGGYNYRVQMIPSQGLD